MGRTQSPHFLRGRERVSHYLLKSHFCNKVGVFGVGHFNCVIQTCHRPNPIATVTKMCGFEHTELAISGIMYVGDKSRILPPDRRYLG